MIARRIAPVGAAVTAMISFLVKLGLCALVGEDEVGVAAATVTAEGLGDNGGKEDEVNVAAANQSLSFAEVIGVLLGRLTCIARACGRLS